MNLGCDLFIVIVLQLFQNGCCNPWQQLESWRLGPFLYMLCWGRVTILICKINEWLRGREYLLEACPSKACLLFCALTRMFLSNAPSSFATGIVLQRFAIIDQRRHTRGGQSLLMWRQWFCFFRMFGIVFLPAQSGRCCHGDSGSSWLRSCRPSERRRMENRHWTANPSFLISNSHRKAQELQKTNSRHTSDTAYLNIHAKTDTTQSDYFTNPHLGVFCLLLHLLPSPFSSAHPPSLTSSRHIQWKQWD